MFLCNNARSLSAVAPVTTKRSGSTSITTTAKYRPSLILAITTSGSTRPKAANKSKTLGFSNFLQSNFGFVNQIVPTLFLATL